MKDTKTISDDTICAVSTPAGVGGIAVVRISGRDAIAIADSVWRGASLARVGRHTAHLGTITDASVGDLDQAVATVFRAPASFTGEDVVEFSIHGSSWIQAELIRLLIRSGCRLAEAGEFTRRAFAAGKMDLTEAEAVADVIASSSRAAHRVAMQHMRGGFSSRLETLRGQLLDLAALLELELDFSEEEVEFASREQLIRIAEEIDRMITHLTASYATGSVLKEGIPVAIVGETNAGKSTLMNRLLHEEKAIVSDIHGTTRDVIEDTIDIDGILFRLIDTAGLRDTADPIETIGIRKALEKASAAHIVLWLIDPTAVATLEPTADLIKGVSPTGKIIAVINKMDIPGVDLGDTEREVRRALPEAERTISISALNDVGIRQLTDAIVDASGAREALNDEIMVTNARHFQALTNAQKAIKMVISGLHGNLSGDLIAQDLREALHHLGEITGTITTPDILSTIFERFCIGK